MNRANDGIEGSTSPPPATLFCGLICSPAMPRGRVFEILRETWGDVEFIGRRIPFSYTSYYDEEMGGGGLFRKFLTFSKFVAQESLPDLKRISREIEGGFRHSGGGRTVNIDPGLLLPEKLILATTKPAAHRPYLGQGVYAEVALIFERGSYRPLPWTYPDYSDEETIRMLNTLRTRARYQSRWREGKENL